MLYDNLSVDEIQPIVEELHIDELESIIAPEDIAFVYGSSTWA